MGSRYSSAARRANSRSSSSGSGSQAYVIGGIALAVVVIVVLMMQRKGDPAQAADGKQTPAANAAAQPAAAGGTKKNVRVLTSPKTPAPALTAATLDRYGALTEEVRKLYNEGSTLRTAGNNADARAKQAQANQKLDEMQALVAANLLWQEEAEMQNWIQPDEYARLTDLYQKASKLDNLVRKGGG